MRRDLNHPTGGRAQSRISYPAATRAKNLSVATFVQVSGGGKLLSVRKYFAWPGLLRWCVRGGQTIGATDPHGLYAIEDRMHVKDIHASILWLLGLDNMQLTYDHKGRLERPTINEGSFHPALRSG